MSSAGEKLALTAVASMIVGCTTAPPSRAPAAEPVVVIPAAAVATSAEAEPEEPRVRRVEKKPQKSGGNCCKGMNECKGKGMCKVDGSQECKGKNECKGKGGCKPMDCSDTE